jgi:hypothetical protein
VVRVDCPVSSVVEVNLIEDSLAPVEQSPKEPGTVEMALGPFEVRTLRFTRATASLPPGAGP